MIAILACCFSLQAATPSEFALPLQPENWLVLSYNKIPANQVTFAEGTLKIKVGRSAGPVVHKLAQPLKPTRFELRGQVRGLKKLETGSFDEDSVLRFGLVALGKNTLSGPKKWLAADWVKKLFALAPPGLGLDKIYFYNITNRNELVGKSRTHPKSDVLFETVVSAVGQDAEIHLVQDLKTPTEIAAIWLSVDGDDSKSEFETSISEIKLIHGPRVEK